MRILSHYFIQRFLGLFATVLVVAFLILSTIELVLNLDDVTAFDAARAAEVDATPGLDALPGPSAIAPLAHTLRYLALRLTSYYLADILPIASFIAVFAVFAMTARSRERLAIEAGGIRPLRIVVPVLAASLILSFGAAVLHETVILRAEQIWSGASHDRRDPIEFSRDAFWVREGPAITNVARADPETRTLHAVEIFERNATGRVVRVVRAPTVRIAPDGRWQIEDALVWHFDPENVRADPTLERHQTLDLDIEALRGDRLLRADPGLLPLRDLERYLESDPEAPASALRRARGRYHDRLSRPWLVFVFAWLALPFALQVDQRGRIAGPAVAAVATLGLYFLVESAGRTLAQQELIPAGVTPWAAMTIFSLAAAIAIVASPRTR